MNQSEGEETKSKEVPVLKKRKLPTWMQESKNKHYGSKIQHSKEPEEPKRPSRKDIQKILSKL